jgi:hypothetical protein
MRDGNPANQQNWKVVCSICGAEFADTETINLADGHFQQEHPGESIQFHTIWVGKGPTPKRNRTASRPPRRRRR